MPSFRFPARLFAGRKPDASPMEAANFKWPKERLLDLAGSAARQAEGEEGYKGGEHKEEDYNNEYEIGICRGIEAALADVAYWDHGLTDDRLLALLKDGWHIAHQAWPDLGRRHTRWSKAGSAVRYRVFSSTPCWSGLGRA